MLFFPLAVSLCVWTILKLNVLALSVVVLQQERIKHEDMSKEVHDTAIDSKNIE